jgi:predicted porin
MKNAFVFSVLASAAAASFAQDGLTIYGIVDVGATNVSGYKGGSVTMLSSGIMDGTRLGFRGNEDLGGGYRAIFTLEMRIEADNGTLGSRPQSGSQLPDRVSQATLMGLPAALQPVVTQVSAGIGNSVGVNLNNAGWDRQSYAGLVTPFGGFVAGRMYTPAYEMVATFDTLQTQSALSVGQVAAIPFGVDIRLSNSVAYRIAQGGFSAVLSAAAGEGSASTGHFYGGNVMYKGSAFSVGAGYNTRENELGQESLTTAIFGASWNVGPGTISGVYAQITDDNPSGISGIAALITPAVGPALANVVQGAYNKAFRQDADLWQIGYRMTLGSHTFYTAYNSYDDTLPANADVESYGLVYSYALSKRTDINAAVVRFDNSGLGQAAPGGGGYLGGVTASAGTDSTSLALGIRHRF